MRPAKQKVRKVCSYSHATGKLTRHDMPACTVLQHLLAINRMNVQCTGIGRTYYTEDADTLKYLGESEGDNATATL